MEAVGMSEFFWEEDGDVIPPQLSMSDLSISDKKLHASDHEDSNANIPSGAEQLSKGDKQNN